MAPDPTPQPPASQAPPKPETPTASATSEASAPPATSETPAAAGGTSLPATPVPVPDTGYTPSGVPTFDGVREKIETRFGTALGATELAEDTPEGKTAAQQFEARQKAAEEKLEEIRASMHKSQD